MNDNAGVTLQDILAQMEGGEVIDDPRLVAMFRAHNARFFKDVLVAPTFAQGNFGGKYVVYVPVPFRAVVFHPRTLMQHERWISDSLLHEMIHMALDDGKMDTDKDHGARFTAEANRIGRSLGLRNVKPHSDAVTDWPQSIRPKGYADWRS